MSGGGNHSGSAGEKVAPLTRFAPSPTGSLHLGGARTALFSYLYAKHHGGRFLLRIEDTDRARSKKEYEEEILESLTWLGLEADGPPVRQSERGAEYADAIKKLEAGKNLYRCFCSKEDLEAMRKKAQAEKRPPRYDRRCRERAEDDPKRPFVYRFRMPLDGETLVEDLCLGTVRFPNAELDDLIIARSDGSPTYNLTVVVDDAYMRVTHVIRGNDLLANTPKQIHIYRGLGLSPPDFAHLPQIHGPDGKRLSKRHGATGVREYQEAGYLPEALLNYLVRLGWSYEDREILSREEMVELFDFDRVGKSASVFNPGKLLWLNQHYIKECAPDRLLDLLLAELHTRGRELRGSEEQRRMALLADSLRERSKTIGEMADAAGFFFIDEPEIDPKEAKKYLKNSIKRPLEELVENLEALERFEPSDVHGSLQNVIEIHRLKLVDLAQPVRLALTGKTVSPPIDVTVSALGKERALARIRRALDTLK